MSGEGEGRFRSGRRDRFLRGGRLGKSLPERTRFPEPWQEPPSLKDLLLLLDLV